MGSRLFDEIREQRGLAYSVYSVDHAFADVPILQLSAGLESGKCVEAYTRMREIVDELRDDGPRAEEFERARAYAGRPARAGVREHQRRRALRGQPDRRVRRGHRPRRGDRRARRDDARRVAEVARGISVEASVACVGPHATSSPEEFAWRVQLGRRRHGGAAGRAGDEAENADEGHVYASRGVHLRSPLLRARRRACLVLASPGAAAHHAAATARAPQAQRTSKRPAARDQRLPRQPRSHTPGTIQVGCCNPVNTSGVQTGWTQKTVAGGRRRVPRPRTSSALEREQPEHASRSPRAT